MTPKDHPTARLDDQLFYDAFKASPIGIALENLEGQPLFVNPALCSMLGFREEEMLRKHCVEFSPPEDAKRDWALFEQLRAGSIDHYSLEKRFIRRDGSLIWGRLTISLLNRRTSPLVVAMVEDITEKRTVQETLELATKRMAAVARCSRDFRYLWANQRLADLLERPLGEIVGRPIVEVLGTELFEVLRPYFERALAGENVTYEEEVTYPSIGRRWISATYTPTFDAGGIADGWVAVIVDITERKRAEEALRRSEGYLAEAQRLAHSGSWAWNVPTGDAFWSQEMFRILGYDPEKTSPSLSQFLARVHPEDRARMEQVVRQEITGLNVNVLSDYRIVLPDGTIKHLHAIAHPVRNELGEVVEVVGTSMDVTERKLTEEALRESEERFRLVANTAPVMIWMSGTDMLCTYLNQAWLDFTGRSLEHELGNGWTEGLYPGDLERWLDIETKAIGRRESYQMEYRVRRHDGEYRWILQSGVPRFNPDGSFAGYIGSAIDITERKLAEEALALMSQKLIRAQEEERTRLARELHDDINQRLALLALNLESLKQNLPSSAVKLRQQIVAASKEIVDLGSDVQALSHHLHSSKLELLGLAAAATGFCSELSERQGVQIDFHSENVPRDLSPEISLSLFRVLQEALQNAIKHSGSRHFQVSLRGAADEIELRVQDSGVGFEPVTAIQGRGLGVTSMRERLKLVDGQLSIDSKPEQGTTIQARVPIPSRMKSVAAVG